MPAQRHRNRPHRAVDREEHSDSGASARSEDIHVRNYDVHASHTVEVTIYDASATADHASTAADRTATNSSQVAFAARYHLRPGQAESECDVLPPGTYLLEVRCDGVRRERERCTVSETPGETATIEIGNGAVSVTETVY